MDIKFQFYEVKRVLGLNGGDGCKHYEYITTELYS